MEPNETRPTVTWEHFCQVTQLNVELLKDNAQLRERLKEDGEVIRDLLNQRQELFDKMVAHGIGWPVWAGVPVKEVPDGTE